MVDLGGYVIVLVEKEGKIKLFGSAAERNDCDEILEINGSSSDKMTHEQIIHHIHQCIKTRTICLRVKRRSSGKLGSSIDSSLIDAFVIGSRAREHLQTLTKDANITPKDIAQLSKILSESNGEENINQRLSDLENKENRKQEKATKDNEKSENNLRKSDSGDIDYLELNDDNMQLLNINPDPSKLKKTDSQQSIVDLVKRSASISLSNTSLNKITYRKLDEEESKKYIPFNKLNTVVNRLEESLDDSNLRKLFEKTNFKQLIDIYATLMQERFLGTSNLEIDTVQLHQEVVELLQNKGNVDDDFLELLEILNKFEYDGLFQVLNYMVKRKKKASLQDDEIQEEDDSIKEELEENVFIDDNQKDESLIEESVSLKEGDFNEDEKSGNEVEIEKSIEEEAEVDKNEIIHEQENEFSLDQSLKNDVCIESEANLIKKESNEDKPPLPPPLPITIINSLNLDQTRANLITTTAEIPSLATLASNMQPISSTKPIELTNQMIHTQSVSRSSHLTSEPSRQNNILQNTFLTTVNSTLNNFPDTSTANHPQVPQNAYYSTQSANIQSQQLLQQQQQQQNLIYNLPLDKQSIQPPNLCNLEYSNLIQQNRTNNLIHQTLTQNQAVTPIPVLSAYDLPLNNNVQLNELNDLPALPITNLAPNVANIPSLQPIPNLISTNQLNPTISALEYANGSIPPPPPAPVQTQIITSLPPNLNNLPPNLPTNTKLSIVKIEKHSTEPLGATVKNEDDGRVTIGRIVCGGAAQKCSALAEGDEILMVNNHYIRGKTVDQVCELLAQMNGTLTFIIAKRDLNNLERKKSDQTNLNVSSIQRKSSTSSHDSANLTNGKVTHFKAFFDYNPSDDIYIPCRELGLSFRRGDLLHIIDSTDDCWWQAYKEGDTNQNLAGLIPSLKFQNMRKEAVKKLNEQNEKKKEEQVEVDSLDSSTHRHRTSLLFNCGKRSTSKKRKTRKEEELPIQDYCVPYEEVKQCMTNKRTVVLIGPNNIGRQMLRERLVKHKNLYGTAIPHTSRSKRSNETNGEDYYFVSKQQFEQFIEEGKFVEFGDYDRNYYGTSFSSIEDVLKSNKTCILNLHVQSIPVLRKAGNKLKPYFVFISPPANLDVLRKLVESINNVPISKSELHGILNEAWEIKQYFAHYFDLILTVTDIEETYKLLLNEINSLDKEAQWIPASWIS